MRHLHGVCRLRIGADVPLIGLHRPRQVPWVKAWWVLGLLRFVPGYLLVPGDCLVDDCVPPAI